MYIVDKIRDVGLLILLPRSHDFIHSQWNLIGPCRPILYIAAKLYKNEVRLRIGLRYTVAIL